MIEVYNGRGLSDTGRGRICSRCGALVSGTIDGVAIEACISCHSPNGIESCPEPCGIVNVIIRGSLILPFDKDEPPQLEIDVQYE